MIPSRKFLVVPLAFVAAYLVPCIHSLSIPPTPKVAIDRDTGLVPDFPETTTDTPISTTTDSNIDNEGIALIEISKDPSQSQDVNRDDNANPNETLSGDKPVLEMVDIILQPFRPPTLLVVDFFGRPNNTRKAGSSTEEDNSRSSEMNTESNKGSPFSSSNEKNSMEKDGSSKSFETQEEPDTSGTQESGVSHFAKTPSVARQPESTKTDEITSSSAQRQFSSENDDNNDAGTNIDKEFARNGGNDDESLSSSTMSSTTLAAAKDDVIIRDNKERRRRRETHQMDNNSKDAGSTSTNPNSSESIKKFSLVSATKKLTALPTTTTSPSNDDDSPSDANGGDGSDDDGDDNGQHKTSANKTGTVRIFLEILQLEPVPSNSADDGTNSDTTDSSSNDGVALPAENDEIEDKTVIHSLKANSNQKISTANSTTPSQSSVSEDLGIPKRVARAASTQSTAQPKVHDEAAEKKGNPSTSPVASASPSSTTTRKPLTSKEAPAAPSPSSTNVPEKSVKTSTTVDDSEGPPLENVTEPIEK